MIFSLGCMIAESAVTGVSWCSACGAQRTRPAHHIVGVRQVDDDDLVGFIYILATACQLSRGKAGRGREGRGARYAHADEVVGLEGERLERDALGLDAQRGELTLAESRGRCRAGVADLDMLSELGSAVLSCTVGGEGGRTLIGLTSAIAPACVVGAPCAVRELPTWNERECREKG